MSRKEEPDYKYQYKKPKRRRRVEGDEIWYFILHNIYSALLFGMVGYILGIFNYQFMNLFDIFTRVFLDVLIYVILLMIICGLLGRGLAYITLKIIFERQRKTETPRAMKKIGELNSGINKIVSISYLITVMLSAFIFTLGIFPILQMRLFSENTFTTIVWTYLIIKISIFGIVRLISGFKL